MLCSQVHSVFNVMSKHDLHPSPRDVLAVVCGSCTETDSCPATNGGAAVPSVEIQGVTKCDESGTVRTPVRDASSDTSVSI